MVDRDTGWNNTGVLRFALLRNLTMRIPKSIVTLNGTKARKISEKNNYAKKLR